MENYSWRLVGFCLFDCPFWWLSIEACLIHEFGINICNNSKNLLLKVHNYRKKEGILLYRDSFLPNCKCPSPNSENDISEEWWPLQGGNGAIMCCPNLLWAGGYGVKKSKRLWKTAQFTPLCTSFKVPFRLTFIWISGYFLILTNIRAYMYLISRKIGSCISRVLIFTISGKSEQNCI